MVTGIGSLVQNDIGMHDPGLLYHASLAGAVPNSSHPDGQGRTAIAAHVDDTSNRSLWSPHHLQTPITRYPSVTQQPLNVISYPSPAESGSSVSSPPLNVPTVQPRPTFQALDHGHPLGGSASPMESVTALSGSPFPHPASVHVASPSQDATSAGFPSPEEGFISKVVNKPSPQSPSSGGTVGLQRPSKETNTDLSTAQDKWHAYLTTVTDNYGLDCGRPDLDLNKNNDHAAIEVNYALDLITSTWKNDSTNSNYRSEPEEQNTRRSEYGYYAWPVPINIPRYLSPLPSTLVKNPINLMYFHHFLNHTARMFIPHDCSDNPFISVMPSSKCRCSLLA